MSSIAAIHALTDALIQTSMVVPHGTVDPAAADAALGTVADLLYNAVEALQVEAAVRADDAAWCDVECWATEALFEAQRVRPAPL